jgi:hypothetical protein
MEESATVKDIALLIFGAVIGVVPWLLEKAGIDMPKPIYVGLLVLSPMLAGWALIKLGWLERIAWLQDKKLSLSSSLIVLASLVFIVWILARTTELFSSQFKAYTDIPLNSLEQVTNRTFENETIDVDGKDFRNCTFTNVTLVFKGEKTSAFQFSLFLGTLHVVTNNPSIGGFGETLRAFEMLQRDGSVKSWTDERGFHVLKILSGAKPK